MQLSEPTVRRPVADARTASEVSGRDGDAARVAMPSARKDADAEQGKKGAEGTELYEEDGHHWLPCAFGGVTGGGLEGSSHSDTPA